MIVLAFISVQAVSPVRHAFYETFLNVHIILMFICAWLHCTTAALPGGLPQLSWVSVIVLLWVADRLADRLACTARLLWVLLKLSVNHCPAKSPFHVS